MKTKEIKEFKEKLDEIKVNDMKDDVFRKALTELYVALGDVFMVVKARYEKVGFHDASFVNKYKKEKRKGQLYYLRKKSEVK